MKKADLKAILQGMGVPEEMYHLENHGNNDQKLCLNKENDVWFVYYSERGSKLVPAEFDNEDDACEEFMKRINKMMDNAKKRQRP